MELIGLAEVAEIAGVSRQAVVNWRSRFPDFPVPSAQLASGPVWERATIEKWLERREASMAGAASPIIASGKLETRDMAVSDFDGVEIGEVTQAEITRADTFSVKVTADDNVLPYVDVSKSEGTLKVHLKVPFTVTRVTSIRVVITMPRLKALRASGAARATVKGFGSKDPLALGASGASVISLEGLTAGDTWVSVSGAGRVTGSLDAGDGRFQASGAGNITLKGHGGMVGLDVSGAGSARLSEFAATGMSVKLSGTSRAAVNLKGKLDAAVSGVSKLSYSGEVEMGAVKVSGMSRLERE